MADTNKIKLKDALIEIARAGFQRHGRFGALRYFLESDDESVHYVGMDGANMMDFHVDHDGWITIPADQFRADLEWAVKDTLKRKVPAP